HPGRADRDGRCDRDRPRWELDDDPRPAGHTGGSHPRSLRRQHAVRGASGRARGLPDLHRQLSDRQRCQPMADDGAESLYEQVGGMAFFERLVDVFYAGVEADPVLLALYPQPDDLAGARQRLTLFLAQYWGGPTTYSDERG